MSVLDRRLSSLPALRHGDRGFIYCPLVIQSLAPESGCSLNAYHMQMENQMWHALDRQLSGQVSMRVNRDEMRAKIQEIFRDRIPENALRQAETSRAAGMP